jgi:hypothetical protein
MNSLKCKNCSKELKDNYTKILEIEGSAIKDRALFCNEKCIAEFYSAKIKRGK